jgi:hypothetical protein
MWVRLLRPKSEVWTTVKPIQYVRGNQIQATQEVLITFSYLDVSGVAIQADRFVRVGIMAMGFCFELNLTFRREAFNLCGWLPIDSHSVPPAMSYKLTLLVYDYPLFV